MKAIERDIRRVVTGFGLKCSVSVSKGHYKVAVAMPQGDVTFTVSGTPTIREDCIAAFRREVRRALR